MMYGTREPFEYGECGECGSLQLSRVPEDLEAYYPADYYAFVPPRMPRGLNRWLRKKRLQAALGERSLVSSVDQLLRGPAVLFGAAVVADLGLDLRSAKVLDIGCGSGRFLQKLYLAGCRNLGGIDPYIDRDREIAPNVWIRKAKIEDLDEPHSFDLVTLHHVLEHLADPQSALGHIASLIRPAGSIVIRVPVAGTYAWRRYGADWVQLDPPRHRFIPSEGGLRVLAGRVGLEVEKVVYDSTRFQFVGSEGYLQGIALRDQDGSYVSTDLEKSYDDFAARLNAANDGDQAAFRLRTSNPS